MFTLLVSALVSQYPLYPAATVQVPFQSQVGYDLAARQAYYYPVNPPVKFIVVPSTPVSGKVTQITADTIYVEGGLSFRWSRHMSFLPRFPKVGENVLRQGANVYIAERRPYATPGPGPGPGQ